MGDATSGDPKVTVIPGRTYPTPEAERIFTMFLPAWQAHFLRKNAGYRGMHKDLGTRAQYVDLHRKVGKVRLALWEGVEDIGPETLEEVLFDLIGHCFLTLDLLDEERVHDEGRSGQGRGPVP